MRRGPHLRWHGTRTLHKHSSDVDRNVCKLFGEELLAGEAQKWIATAVAVREVKVRKGQKQQLNRQMLL